MKNASVVALRAAWRGIALDQSFLSDLSTGNYRPRKALLALRRVDLQVALMMRIATHHSAASKMARRRLLARAIDLASGATISGAIYLPHPLGIVIGAGVVVGDRATLYQHVTLGSDRAGGYPTIGREAVIYTGAIVFGQVHVRDRTVIGAGVILNRDTLEGEIIRR